MAMHAFSAVPDIESDKKAGIQTVATVLGKRGTVIFCYIAYLLAASLAVNWLGVLSFVGAAIYGALMSLAFFAKTKDELFGIYRIFPYVNIGLGFILFLVIALKHYY